MELDQIVSPPEPLIQGTFAIYPLPDGGRILAYRPEGEEDSQQIHIPAFLMKMWDAQQRGEQVNPMQAMRAMMSGGF